MRYTLALIAVCCSITIACFAYANQQKIEQKRVELEEIKNQVQTEKLESNPSNKDRVKEDKIQPEPLKEQQSTPQKINTPSSGNTLNKPININWSTRKYWTSQMPKNALALTFDDGPSPKYTEQILDILKRYNVKATFFVVGYRVKKHCPIVKRIVREGHELGNHTYNHYFLTKHTAKTQKKQIERAQQVIERCVGKRHLPRWFRAPYGDQDTSILKIANDMGLNTALWTMGARDWHKDSTKKSIEDDLLKSQGQNIALLHDGTEANPEQSKKDKNSKSPIIDESRQKTVDALDKSIRGLKQRGIQFVTMSEAFPRQ